MSRRVHPRDGHEPSDEAAGSNEFPSKRAVVEWGGVDEMGPWLRPRVEDTFLLSQQTVHMNPGCPLITRGAFQLCTCYCVDKLHRCFHYDVDNNFFLHTNRRCSENVDIATGQVWPVVVCRRCCSFPETLRWNVLRAGNLPAAELRNSEKLRQSLRKCWIGVFDCMSCRVFRARLALMLGRHPPVSNLIGNILRQLEGLRRDELVWLHTYLTGRLRALPPSDTSHVPPQVAGTSTCRSDDLRMSGGPIFSYGPLLPHTTVALAEQIGEFNHARNPWKRTGADLQDWFAPLQQRVAPIPSYGSVFFYGRAERA